MENVLIWSNSLGSHKTLQEYKEAILKNKNLLMQFDIHVLLNKCIPAEACIDMFSMSQNVFFGRKCETTVSKYKMIGDEFLLRHSSIFANAYILDNGPKFTAAEIDMQKFAMTKCIDKSKLSEIMVQQDMYIDGCPKAKYNQTTGFISYFTMLQLKPGCNVSLCNFGIRDSLYQTSKSMHTIDYEDSWFNKHNVERISI